MGLIYDEVEGLNFFTDFALVQAPFADPALLAERRHHDVVRGYLEDAELSPLPLRRLAEQNAIRATEVFRRLLQRPDFTWERDGEALLRHHKAAFYKQPPQPAVRVVGEALAQASFAPQEDGPARAARQLGRNDPCPCGSGRKYKKCCGR